MIHTAKAAAGSGRRARRRRARTEAILEHAFTVVARHGLAGLTIQRLSDALDSAPGALYRYFPSKQAILAELTRGVIDALRERLERVLAACVKPRTSPLVGLLIAAEAYVAFARDEPRRFGLVQAVLGTPRAILDDDASLPVIAAMRGVLAPVAALFEAAAERRALSSTGRGVERAFAYWAALHGLLQLQKLTRFEPEEVPLAEHARALARTLLAGYGAKRDALRRADARLGKLDVRTLLRTGGTERTP